MQKENSSLRSAANTPENTSDYLKAISLMVLAVTLFSGLDAAAKYLVTVYGHSVAQIAWTRFAVQFVLLAIFVPALGLVRFPDMFRTNALRPQLIRSGLMAATTVFNFLAVKYLRLDQTVTIAFLAPLVVAILAGPMLGEWVGWRRMTAIIVGFIGVLIAVHPGAAPVHPAVLFSFASMIAYAFFMIITRQIAALDSPWVTLFYSMFAGTALGAPIAFANWQWPTDTLSLALLLSLGLFGGAGHYLFLHAYRLAPASSVAPFLYLQLISMVGLGWLVFSDVPDVWTLSGAAIIIASGVYLVHRERVTRAGRL